MPTQHTIIGAGPAAINAIETIRQFDQGESQITLICDEPAHARMALPYWLAGQIPREQTYTGDDAYFEKLGVTTHIGQRVDSIDTTGKSVTLSGGEQISFDNLLIATGSSPIGLPIPGTDLPGVQPLWSLAHTESVLNATANLKNPRVVMIGAGFIGFIMLNAMHKRGWNLTVVERETQVLPRMLDASAGQIVGSWLDSKGVQLHSGTSLQSITDDGGVKKLQLDNGKTIEADLVIIATGVQPNVQLAKDAGLEIDHGILVDDHQATSSAGIYAAGDVAQGAIYYSDQKEIHAIQPTAVDHGRVAGANMAGQDIRYPGSLSMNVLDVCGLQCASYGNWADGKDQTVISNPGGSIYRKFVWTDDQITGAIFMGKANDMGMLTDVGMIKGIMQTQSSLGKWKGYLQENPFDVRRVFVANRVAEKLAKTTLIGRPSATRKFHYGGASPKPNQTTAHAAYVKSKAK